MSSLLYSCSINELIDLLKLHYLTLLDGNLHTRSTCGLYTDYLCFRRKGLDICSDSGSQATATDRDKHIIRNVRHLRKDLITDGSLSFNNLLVIKWRDESLAALLRILDGS